MAPNAIQLTGNGVEPALLSLSPSAPVSLGGVLIGTIGGSQVFTVSNAIGHATTGPITVSLGGDVSDFSLVANDCTQLSAGTSCASTRCRVHASRDIRPFQHGREVGYHYLHGRRRRAPRGDIGRDRRVTA